MNAHSNPNMSVSTILNTTTRYNIPITQNTSTRTDTVINIQNKVARIVFVLVPKCGVVLVAGTNDL